MTATFDYKGFAKDLTKQAESVMPEDIALKHKKEFLDRIYDFTYIAGEAFSNDDTIEDSETAKVLTQMISECSKCVSSSLIIVLRKCWICFSALCT